MPAKPRVMIVDASLESREILRTLLRRTGTETVETNGPRRATRLFGTVQPDLIVLDEDCVGRLSERAAAELGQAATRNAIPIVVLGTVKQEETAWPTRHLVAKPYHYGALIRRIEGLLGDRTDDG